MLAWNDKEELKTHLALVQSADTSEDAGEALIRYVRLIQTIPESHRAVSSGIQSLTGFASSYTNDLYRLVQGGAGAESVAFKSIFNQSSLYSQGENRIYCIIASQLNLLISSIDVASDKDTIIFDNKRFCLTSKNDTSKIALYDEGGKETKMFKIIKSIKSCKDRSSTTHSLAEKTGLKSRNIARSFPDINRKFRASFKEDLIVEYGRSGKRKLFKLNGNFNYS